MNNTSKICDAADWFDPEIKFIIEQELKEPARFHRKQWEFAMIFLTLKKFGLLNNKKIGLSLGGGNERVLYSIAEHVKKLIVTDLYDDNTSWDCARTSDPDEFIKSSKPFPVDESKIQALRMDMRFLDFADSSFDFCYSSCAIEHIGEYKDFLQHLNEVNRVLKNGGIYVFTTELQFGDKIISDQNNFIFTREYISDLIANSDLDFVSNVNSELTSNQINYPFPSNLKNLTFIGNNYLSQKLFEQFPHLILLRGNIPFTSVLLILKKSSTGGKSGSINFYHYDAAKKFLLEGVENYRRLIDENKVSIFPYSILPDNVSPFCIDHSDYFLKSADRNNPADTVFHSDYFWFGTGRRIIKIIIKTADADACTENVLQIRIHSFQIYNSSDVKCVYEKKINVDKNTLLEEKIELYAEEDSNYAVLCKMISGNISCRSISIESCALKNAEESSIVVSDLEGVGYDIG